MSDDIRQKFTGYQKDKETSLDFAEARMYENRFGRFTAVDPLLASGKSANPQTFNQYIYVMNNPLVLTDPSGQCPTGNCPQIYSGPVYVKTVDAMTWYNNIQEDDSWKEFEGDKTITVGGMQYRIFNYGADSNGGSGWYPVGEATSDPELDRFLNPFPRRWQEPMPMLGGREDYLEAIRYKGHGKFTITDNGETDYEAYEDNLDKDKAFSMAVGMMASLGQALGSSGSPPSTSSNSSNFAENLFHSKIFGKNSALFGNKEFSQSNSPGLLNRPGNNFKAGWSGGSEEMNFINPRFNNGGLNLKTFKASNPTFTGGGRQFRITIGVNSNFPNRGNFHFYIPRTFVPNTVANPYKVP